MEAHFLKRIEAVRGQTTILMTTHRPSHMRMADRVVVLENGRVTANGPPGEAAPQPPAPPPMSKARPAVGQPAARAVV